MAEVFLLLKDGLKQLLPYKGNFIGSELADRQAIVNTISRQQMAGRQEILTKVISTCVGLAVSFSITYFGIKWLVNAMDPTREEKQQSQKRVRTLT